MMAAAVCAALAPGSLNDIAKTPGAVRTTDRASICHTKTSTVRNVPASVRRKVFASYGLTNKTGWCAKAGCELDHLVSLELGGSNDAKNLWPESYSGQWNAHQKDQLENRLHKLICNGSITVKDAQAAISRDWISAYQKYIGK
jgi:hypothetical protein